MGKTKIVLLSIQKLFKDKEKSSDVTVTVIGMYKSYNDRLTNNLSDVVTRLLIDIPEAIEKMNNDKNAWRSLYRGIADLFDNDDSLGSSHVLLSDVGEYEEILLVGAVMPLENCSDNDLRFWLNTPKSIQKYEEEQQNKYKLPEIKPNNTYYTN